MPWWTDGPRLRVCHRRFTTSVILLVVATVEVENENGVIMRRHLLPGPVPLLRCALFLVLKLLVQQMTRLSMVLGKRPGVVVGPAHRCRAVEVMCAGTRPS